MAAGAFPIPKTSDSALEAESPGKIRTYNKNDMKKSGPRMLRARLRK
jgi:hypothetical protein